MSVTLTGTYDGGVVLLDSPAELDEKTRVRVTLEPLQAATGAGFLETAMKLRISGPADWATNLEQHLHGPLASDD